MDAQTAGDERALTGRWRPPLSPSFGDGTGPLVGQRVGNTGVSQRATDTKRNELPGRLLDEMGHDGVPRNLREMLPEAAAVGVRRRAVGPTREQQRIPGRARPVVCRVGCDYLTMKAPLRTSARREPRLVVRRQSFGHPARLILIGKKSGRAAEHRLQRLPETAAPIEVEDVSQLVHDHEPLPAVEGL